MEPDQPDDEDDLDGYETGMTRLVRRTAPWIAGALAIALLVPAVGGLLDELVFRRDRTTVEGSADGLADAVYLVRAVGCDGRARSGSAFVASVDGRRVLVTNRHVVVDSRVVSVRPLAGTAALEVVGLRVSLEQDVAVIDVTDPEALPTPLRLGTRPRDGDPVRLIGFPAARPFTTAGVVAEVTLDRVLLDLRVDPGASGSPIVDRDGAVVAQVYAQTEDGLGVATAAGAVARSLRDAEPAALGC